MNDYSKNPYFYFLKRSILFLSILFVLDFSIGYALQYFYFTQESGLMYRTTYSIEKTNAELLVFGSSRANHHYDPTIFEKELNLSYYNVGRDGSFILYHYAVLEGVLKRYKPKMILLDISEKEFVKDKVSYDRLACLLPYYKNHSEIQPIIELRGKYEKYKLLSSIYPYNSALFTIAIGNTEFNKKRKQDVKGYVALFDQWKLPIETINNNKEELDSVKVNYYKKFILKCRTAGVKLNIIHSPRYYKLVSTDTSIEEAKSIAVTNHIPFYDLSNDTVYLNNPDLFSDTYHLNNKGAKIFSENICRTFIHLEEN
jgi:hypothetical protein